jgi:3-oxoacyl-[acyl-carrier protein] reductase
MLYSCEGKVLLISGGSRGLGLAIATAYLERGAAVATFARHRTAAMDGLDAGHPGRFLFAEVDAVDAVAVEAFVAAMQGRFGRVDFLVNNAAVGQDHLLAHMPPDLIRRLVEINVVAPILLTRAVVRRMLLQGSGRIVNISSICGSRGYPGLSVYSATKGAMDAFTRALARELGGRGLLVNSLAPGFFASEMSRVLAPEQLEVIRRRTPTGKLVSEEDLLPALDGLLLGPGVVTGQTVFVDGGATT